MNEKILAFIPAADSEAGVARVLAGFQGPIARRFDEILVLDDHSRDDTLAVAIAAAETREAPRVTVGLNLERYGVGGAHKTAFAYARRGGFSHVVALDGNDRADIVDVGTLLSQGVHRRFDACLGARFAPGAKLEGYDGSRVFGNRAGNLLASLATRRNVRDLGAGLNIFAMSALDDSDLARLPDDDRFLTFLMLDLIDKGRSIRFFPIHWRDSDPIASAELRKRARMSLGALTEFALRRGRFRKMDYRETPRPAYEFEAAYVSGAPPIAGPGERRRTPRQRAS